MKVKLIFALLFVSTLFSFKADNPIKILFFGDSITQAGIGKTGYITKMAEMLSSKGLSGKYELIGAGIGGNKIYDLYLRHEEDVIAKKPNIVVIYIGINDVWHKTLIGEKYDASNENDGDLNYFSNVIRKIALDEHCKLIDLRKAFIDYETKFNTENKALGILTSDRVHLNEAGNVFLAEVMWDVLKDIK